jgi:hypothetical protein
MREAPESCIIQLLVSENLASKIMPFAPNLRSKVLMIVTGKIFSFVHEDAKLDSKESYDMQRQPS